MTHEINNNNLLIEVTQKLIALFVFMLHVFKKNLAIISFDRTKSQL